MNTPKPMAGATETIAALDLSDSQWGALPRAVGYKLRQSVFVQQELLTACNNARSFMGDKPADDKDMPHDNVVRALIEQLDAALAAVEGKP